jgi:hypothetical protein
MAKRDENQNDAKPREKRWTNHAISLFLLVALIVVATSTYFSRQQWWEMYLSYHHR